MTWPDGEQLPHCFCISSNRMGGSVSIHGNRRVAGYDFVEVTDAMTGEIRSAQDPRYLWSLTAEEWLAHCRGHATHVRRQMIWNMRVV
jgi:hypothetical protein